jgi:hypothetical protein
MVQLGSYIFGKSSGVLKHSLSVGTERNLSGVHKYTMTLTTYYYGRTGVYLRQGNWLVGCYHRYDHGGTPSI